MLTEPYRDGASSNLFYDENGSGQCQGNPRMTVSSHVDNGDGTYSYTIRVLRLVGRVYIPDSTPLAGVSSSKILQYIPTPGPGNDL